MTTGQLIDIADKWLSDKETILSPDKSRNDMLMLMVSFHQHLLQQYHVMPSLLEFEKRRQKLALSVNEVAEATGVPKTAIKAIERKRLDKLNSVQKLHDYYASNGA